MLHLHSNSIIKGSREIMRQKERERGDREGGKRRDREGEERVGDCLNELSI